MKRASIFALPLLFTLTLACDTDDESSQSAELEARAAEDIEPERDVAPGEHHGEHQGKRRGAKLDQLCAEIECSAEQRSAIDELLAEARPERPDPAEHEAHRKALADAFRSDSFSLESLPKPDESRHAEREAQLAATIVGLHGLLTPEQRSTLADRIEQDGPLGLLGHGRHGKGKHGKGKHGKHPGGESDAPIDHADKLAHKTERKVEKLCEVVSCTDAQVGELSTIFTETFTKLGPPARPQIDPSVQQAFADAFRGESLDVARVEALLDAARPERPHGKLAMKGELLVAVHGVLTPEQRNALADELLEGGPEAVFGGKHHGKQGERKHGKRKQGQREVRD